MAPYTSESEIKQPELPDKLYKTKEATVYEQLVPKNENQFMTFLRQWERRQGFVTPLIWTRIIALSLVHIVPVVWILYNISQRNFPKLLTIAFVYFSAILAGFGVTGGVHRHFTHRSYKAKWPLKVFLLICFSLAGQNSVLAWVRDHRVHHKYSETAADPHDSNRGFFFAHCGWLMMRKHPKVLEEGGKIDLTDITDDPLLKFHTKYFALFKMTFSFIIPMLIPLLWGEKWDHAVLQVLIRQMFTLNATWSVNSFAHIYGNRPYNSHIRPAENWGVSFASIGEGWHNYHHAFPWDYKAAELPYKLNLTTYLLDLFNKVSLAYDMKSASPALVKSMIEKQTGMGHN